MEDKIAIDSVELKENDVKDYKKKRIIKRKVCVFCADKTKTIDYKEQKIARFVSEKGKIIPRRQTGTCARHQRELALAIKRARFMALLPYKGE